MSLGREHEQRARVSSGCLPRTLLSHIHDYSLTDARRCAARCVCKHNLDWVSVPFILEHQQPVISVQIFRSTTQKCRRTVSTSWNVPTGCCCSASRASVPLSATVTVVSNKRFHLTAWRHSTDGRGQSGLVIAGKYSLPL